jgi:hypothetical protein
MAGGLLAKGGHAEVLLSSGRQQKKKAMYSVLTSIARKMAQLLKKSTRA